MSDTTSPAQTDRTRFDSTREPHGNRREVIALACGILAIATAVWAYWMVLPGVVLGIVAVALGWSSRRNGSGEGGSVAIALGIVALFLVPSVLVVVDAAEDWARSCAEDPTHDPNC